MKLSKADYNIPLKNYSLEDYNSSIKKDKEFVRKGMILRRRVQCRRQKKKLQRRD